MRSTLFALVASVAIAGCTGDSDKERRAKERREKERAKVAEMFKQGPIERVYEMPNATLRVVRIPMKGTIHVDYRICYVWESPKGVSMDCPAEDSVMDFGDIDWRDESDKPRAKP
jgi:hypothetical protein